MRRALCQTDNPLCLKRTLMDDPILTVEERESINAGRWFSSLSPSLRHDILRCAYVKRLKDGVPAKVAAVEYDPNRSARIAPTSRPTGARMYASAFL